ncbi:hypothetical protein [Arthrobacter sp. SLBN-122]|uniref:hypothetical protein n=1 Tax=Arthrobacter sp. SLBN-122 TaxID=2768455 RepID=UPI00114F0AB0|nr:hypothetical protein [Arthrobacter sp. SLBN-122]TQJ36728.1 hypothetical protein FBY36_4034 [Arthrobacter sp. SLBN-122]
MPTLKFKLDGVPRELEWTQPGFTGKDVHRCTYGQEPKVIATFTLTDGSTIEVHGIAEHWTKDEVVVCWTADEAQHCKVWTLTGNVRRPDEGEWKGRFVPR